MLRTTALTAAIAALAAAPAAAQSYKGFYGSVLAGYNDAGDHDADYAAGGEFDYEGGTALGAALGYAYGGGLRGELELMNRSNEFDSTSGAGAPNGDTDVTSLMINAVYDLDIAKGLIVPFVGAGVGYARAKTEVTAGPGTTVNALGVSETDGGGAWQAFAGFAVPLAEDVAFELQYRYFAAFDGFSYDNSGVHPVGGALAAQTVSADYEVETILASLRWNFGAAAPVRPKPRREAETVAPATTAPATFAEEEAAEALEDLELTIYFDLNSSSLTNAARTLIANAAAQAKDGEISSVLIEGNTDTSGSSAYNRILSQRRANAVRDALIAQGIPASLISVSALGESNLATNTPDGAREPVNRRADVTIKFQ